MNDPHVVSLRYRLESDETLVFDNPPAFEIENHEFSVCLANGIVIFKMREHHASEQTARERIEPYLRAWEINFALQLGRHHVRFVLEKIELIDQGPLSAGSARRTNIVYSTGLWETPTPVLTLQHYPPPPAGFVVSPDVETLWHRYRGYLERREPLASMAYFCLSALQWSTGQHKNKLDAVAKRYNIELGVLNRLGHLTSTVGDERSARKFDLHSNRRPYTESEITWIEAVVKALIWRLGEYAYDPTAPHQQITMADFPTI